MKSIGGWAWEGGRAEGTIREGTVCDRLEWTRCAHAAQTMPWGEQPYDRLKNAWFVPTCCFCGGTNSTPQNDFAHQLWLLLPLPRWPGKGAAQAWQEVLHLHPLPPPRQRPGSQTART